MGRVEGEPPFTTGPSSEGTAHPTPMSFDPGAFLGVRGGVDCSSMVDFILAPSKKTPAGRFTARKTDTSSQKQSRILSFQRFNHVEPDGLGRDRRRCT